MTPRERIAALKRVHSPTHGEPPVGVREVALALLLLALAAATTLAPGLLSDASRYVIADWQVCTGVSILLAALNGWALLGVRAMAWQTRACHVLLAVILACQVADTSLSQQGMTMLRLAFLLLVALFVTRTIVRPNDAERLAALERQLKGD